MEENNQNGQNIYETNTAMTEEEMDKFLESIGGLENGYFTDRPPITSSWCFECGKGWYPFFLELGAGVLNGLSLSPSRCHRSINL